MRKILLAILLMCTIPGHAEQIISKQDADNIFSMSYPAWERYARAVSAPQGWKMQLREMDTGTGIMSFNPNGGYGLSTQPLYANPNAQSPDALIVGNYYPKGTIPPNTEELKASLKQAAEEDLGPGYEITVIIANLPPFEVVEVHVRKPENTPIK